MEIKKFNPDEVTPINSGIFGLPHTENDAQIVLIPAPWGVTVSYGGGTHDGPQAIFDASSQIDYYHETYGENSWKIGVHMLSLDEKRNTYKRGKQLRSKAERYIQDISRGRKGNQKVLAEVNLACEVFHEEIQDESSYHLENGKIVGLVGGDHSTPYGLIKALSKKHADFGILQIDAHCDLRKAYEGFMYSHASIMWNVLNDIPEVKKLVQVGIRDYSASERSYIDSSNQRVVTYYDADNKENEFNGAPWSSTVQSIIQSLPQKVYISFDIDGLNPSLCPNTGTPVPGGLSFEQAVFLMKNVAKSGRTIIGFDVNEVSPRANDNEWNANVGMRILWELTLWAAYSNKLTYAK